MDPLWGSCLCWDATSHGNSKHLTTTCLAIVLIQDGGWTDAKAHIPKPSTYEILWASLNVERPETYEAKRWGPWLMVYSGARTGEMAPLRRATFGAAAFSGTSRSRFAPTQ